MATTGASLLGSFSFEDPFTIIRNRGAVVVGPQAGSADLEVRGAYGAGIVSAEALAIGITAIPHPYRDADWSGWMVWRSFAFMLDVTTDIGRLITSQSMEIDSKAMRKVGPNEALVFVAESQGGAFQIFDGVRTLVKLS